MNARNQLLEVKRLMASAQEILATVIELQPKPIPGKPPFPARSQKVERELWNVWDGLKEKRQFTASDAFKLATRGMNIRHTRTVSSYSAILSRWAEQGHINTVEKGSGRRPAQYEIPN